MIQQSHTKVAQPKLGGFRPQVCYWALTALISVIPRTPIFLCGKVLHNGWKKDKEKKPITTETRKRLSIMNSIHTGCPVILPHNWLGLLTSIASLERSKTPFPTSVLDMILSHLMVRLQPWSFGEYGITLDCHYSQVHSYLYC